MGTRNCDRLVKSKRLDVAAEFSQRVKPFRRVRARVAHEIIEPIFPGDHDKMRDTDTEVLGLIGASEDVEFLQGSKSKMYLSLIYPVDPKQLPKELAGVQWPPKT